MCGGPCVMKRRPSARSPARSYRAAQPDSSQCDRGRRGRGWTGRWASRRAGGRAGWPVGGQAGRPAGRQDKWAGRAAGTYPALPCRVLAHSVALAQQRRCRRERGRAGGHGRSQTRCHRPGRGREGQACGGREGQARRRGFHVGGATGSGRRHIEGRGRWLARRGVWGKLDHLVAHQT